MVGRICWPGPIRCRPGDPRRALRSAGSLAFAEGDSESAARLCEEGLALL